MLTHRKATAAPAALALVAENKFSASSNLFFVTFQVKVAVNVDPDTGKEGLHYTWECAYDFFGGG